MLRRPSFSFAKLSNRCMFSTSIEKPWANKNQRIDSVLNATAKNFPNKTAAIQVDINGKKVNSLTFEELQYQTNKLTNVLKPLLNNSGQSVGVLLPRSVDCLVAAAAISRAKATFVPCDELYPAQRTSFVLDDCEANTLITNSKLAASHESARLFSGNIIEIDSIEIDENTTNEQIDNNEMVDEKEAAFIMHTSGSTGPPKGVAFSHQALNSLLESFCEATELDSSTKALLMSTPSGFDISMIELWATMAFGVTAVITPHIEIADWWFKAAVRACMEHNVEFVQGVPSVLQGLLDSGLHLPTAAAVSCGDVLTPRLADQMRNNFARAYNGYGPTETHYCTIYQVPCLDQVEKLPRVISIGKPLKHATAIVVKDDTQPSQLDDDSNLCKVDEPGLLYVGGKTVAIGYKNRENETKSKFINSEKYGRVYATGDRVVKREDGTLEYVGRRDLQLNAGGLRVEAGEIEAAIIRTNGVRTAAVVGLDDGTLVAHISPGMVDAPQVANNLAKLLPPYHVPEYYKCIDELPMLPNNKIDRNALKSTGIENCQFIQTHRKNAILNAVDEE